MKIIIFLKNILKIKNSCEQKDLGFQFCIGMLCKFHQDRSINREISSRTWVGPLKEFKRSTNEKEKFMLY